MVPWFGGDEAPGDWDGVTALFRDGTVAEDYAFGWDWQHHPKDPPHVRAVEIIGYTRKATSTALPLAHPAAVEGEEMLLRLQQAWDAQPDLPPCEFIEAEAVALAAALAAAEPQGEERQGLPTDKYGETALDRLRDHAENGTMPPQFREDLRTVLALAALAPAAIASGRGEGAE